MPRAQDVGDRGRQLDEVFKSGGRFPRSLALGKDDREDGGEFCRRGIVFRETLPDTQDVGEQAQGHARVLGALVFEEQIKEDVAFLESNTEEQVALRAGEFWIDEAAGFEGERRPVEGCGDFLWEMVLKKGTGVFRDREGGLEEFVVGLVDGVCCHGR